MSITVPGRKLETPGILFGLQIADICSYASCYHGDGLTLQAEDGCLALRSVVSADASATFYLEDDSLAAGLDSIALRFEQVAAQINAQFAAANAQLRNR